MRTLEYFDTAVDRVLGSGWQRFVHPDDVERCVARWNASLASGEDYEIEFRLRRRDAT